MSESKEIPNAGEVGELRHSRFGRATVKVLWADMVWADVEVIKGKLEGMGRGSVYGPGESRRVRKTHCYWY